mgnify:FL=1
MLISEHSALGALAASVLTFAWNRRRPDRSLSVMWMAAFGAIAARVPDWDLNLVAALGLSGSNWAHRSVYTHSILGIVLFGILVTSSLFVGGILTKRRAKVNTMPIHIVSIILIVAFATHLLFDMLEAYPIRVLYPFSSHESSGWIPSSVYRNQMFALFTWIVGFGTAIVLSLADRRYALREGGDPNRRHSILRPPQNTETRIKS